MLFGDVTPGLDGQTAKDAEGPALIATDIQEPCRSDRCRGILSYESVNSKGLR